MAPLQPFHLAIPVLDLKKTEDFYVSHFGCKTGRRDSQWVDLDFYGHQLVLHSEHPQDQPIPQVAVQQINNQVDDHAVPVPHFGVVLEMGVWKELAQRLKEKQTEFVIEPYIRFEGQKGEQATMFLMDPSGNALEFKAFADLSLLFAPFEDQVDP